ncbi:tRNA uridine-5-carboxymethylaminomethyl(34) synthesis GTPase MnmE [Lachnospiraceae bacterium]|nr:tRNA uridine-5-carboxymethylaminomethyl(34) synthesis GTPase MnmE [Lachnospiraceae bacterium]
MKGETIAAIATGMTNSGIGVVRMSGEESLAIIDRVYRSKRGKKILSRMPSHTIHYGYICDGETIIDEVMVLIMKAPNSYTAEDTVEIDCHGGVLILTRILETVIKYGARVAQPGEFTKRAFLNGRIDLSQAESVMDLINAKNEFALDSSIRQLQGNVGESMRKIRADIMYEIAFIESALDDPEHISLDGYRDKLKDNIINISLDLERLIRSSENGQLLKEGINTVIVGKPNAGKSSLMNVLVGKERSIVTNIEGTTRDILEEQININGITLNIADTAGVRETENKVEKIGVNKTKEYILNADLIIYVIDSSRELDENDEDILNLIGEKKAIVILNKCDLYPLVLEQEIVQKLLERNLKCTVIPVSVKERIGIEKLQSEIQKLFFAGEIDFNDEIFITNVRHKLALQEALKSLRLVQDSIENQMPEDFYAIDLMNACEELGSITGETVREDLVNEIFSKFCMGK